VHQAQSFRTTYADEGNQAMTEVSKKNVDHLVNQFGSSVAVERRDARTALVQIGSPAVPPLLHALDAAQPHVRWEAAKALAEIADPSAAQRLVAALGDEDEDVQWVVGDALIGLGREALRPLLEALATWELADRMYRGAHHVLYGLAKRPDLAAQIGPVAQAFEGPEPEVTVPVAAEKALKAMAT
jgi:HEAT repeat protein